MTDRDSGDHGSSTGGLHLQISKLLMFAIIAAIAATGALVVTLLVELPMSPPPPGPRGEPPPPPNLQALAVFPVVTGLFVLAWLAVLVVFSRDQILQRLDDLEQRRGAVPSEVVDAMRTELSQQLTAFGARISALTDEYGDLRETDGYLSGMRTAAGQPPEQVVRPLRRMPPQQR
ncbi:hypothetical protein [Mangrovihabitans endophyticus]|nr:hypothetical protein [Mangrovihabitans endophyticus]